MTDKKSILSQARAEGHEQGYWSGRQIHSLEIEEAFQQGVESVKVPSRIPPFLFGYMAGVVVMFLLRVML